MLFLCAHNAGRSQIAAAFLRALASGSAQVFSAGSQPASELNPAVVKATSEVGIDISSLQPQHWTDEMLGAVDVVVTMGCGDECPYYVGKQYLD